MAEINGKMEAERAAQELLRKTMEKEYEDKMAALNQEV